MEAWLLQGLYGGLWSHEGWGAGAVSHCRALLTAKPMGVMQVGGREWRPIPPAVASHNQFLQVSFFPARQK